MILPDARADSMLMSCGNLLLFSFADQTGKSFPVLRDLAYYFSKSTSVLFVSTLHRTATLRVVLWAIKYSRPEISATCSLASSISCSVSVALARFLALGDQIGIDWSWDTILGRLRGPCDPLKVD